MSTCLQCVFASLELSYVSSTCQYALRKVSFAVGASGCAPLFGCSAGPMQRSPAFPCHVRQVTPAVAWCFASSLFLPCAVCLKPLSCSKRPSPAVGNFHSTWRLFEAHTVQLSPGAAILQKRGLFIQTQNTPNPASMMFLPGSTVMEVRLGCPAVKSVWC